MVMAQVYVNGNSLCYKDDKINFIEGVGLRDEVIVDFADATTIRFQKRARIVPPYTREWKIDIVVPPCDAAAIYLANERQHFDLYESESRVVSIDILRENGAVKPFVFKQKIFDTSLNLCYNSSIKKGSVFFYEESFSCNL